MIPAGGMLDIEVIPLEYEKVTTPSRLEVVSHTRGRFEITREGGEFKAVKQQQDTTNISRQGRIHSYYSSNNSVSFKDGKLVENKSFKLPSLANDFKKHGYSQNRKSISSVAFEYTPEEIDMNWIRDEKVIKGTPGKVDFYITQYPDVIIDYLGGPMYVPPSSDPNYEEPVLDVVV